MEEFFYPQCVAVIGVSNTPSNFGKAIFNNLKKFNFTGSCYAVGPKRGIILGKPILPSVRDIPEHVDLAMILVKAENVPEVAEECGKKGVRRLVISTAGFSEFQAERKVLEDRLMKICHTYDMRVIGPNCMAVVNMDNGLFLPFTIQQPANWKSGPVGIISQSGGNALSFAIHLSHEGIGVGKVASIGNKLDIDEVDLLAYYLKDPQIQIIFIYLESFSRAEKLIELARGAGKPILIHKANISPLSSQIALSHTRALAGNDKVVDSVFKQAGIIRIYDTDELINVIKAMLLPPLNQNRWVSMSTRGGTAVMIADECFRYGFTLTPLPDSFLNELQCKARAGVITLTNPIDLGDIHDAGAHIEIIENLMHFPDIDAIVYHLPYSRAFRQILDYPRVFDYLDRTSRLFQKPLVVIMDLIDEGGWRALREEISIPIFYSISGAFSAMKKVYDARNAKAVL